MVYISGVLILQTVHGLYIWCADYADYMVYISGVLIMQTVYG